MGVVTPILYFCTASLIYRFDAEAVMSTLPTDINDSSYYYESSPTLSNIVDLNVDPWTYKAYGSTFEWEGDHGKVV